VLDFDCTDDRVHGLQEGRHFHGYYYDFCFLPLYVFCGERLLVSYLRESNIDSAKHAWAILALLSRRCGNAGRKLKITVRADSGFCRWKMLRWCERAESTTSSDWPRTSACMHSRPSAETGRAQVPKERRKVRLFTQFSIRRRVGIGSDGSLRKPNTPSKGLIRVMFDNLKVARKLSTMRFTAARARWKIASRNNSLVSFSDRTSCHAWWANQFRLLLSSLAYVLIRNIASAWVKRH